MTPAAYYAGAFVVIAGVVLGIKLMGSPKTAVKGNLLGAVCILGAIVLTLVANGVIGYKTLWLSMATGAVIGCVFAVRTAMIQVPELVALFNGLGGGASALVALVVFLGGHGRMDFGARFAASLALGVGALTLSGSLVAAAKLAQRLSQTPIVLKGHTTMTILVMLLGGVLVFLASVAPGDSAVMLAVLTLLIALVFGLVFALRIGGADMPITISLLNSLSGVAAAITGFAVYNPLLVAIGAIVGAAGLILTQLMCQAMNRSLIEVLTGKTVLPSGQQDVTEDEAIQQKQQQRPGPQEPASAADQEAFVASLLAGARKVVIVPGYGMAVAQAQEQVKDLFDNLESLGKEVKFAIHPVAGRMPGHMNVLLAEVEVPYEKLCEMDDINPEFSQTDVVVVVGANDVVNPAAASAEGTPIYGMPILHVSEAKRVIVCNLDRQPGYAGVANLLYGMDNVTLFLGDAKETLAKLTQLLRDQ